MTDLPVPVAYEKQKALAANNTIEANNNKSSVLNINTSISLPQHELHFTRYEERLF